MFGLFSLDAFPRTNYFTATLLIPSALSLLYILLQFERWSATATGAISFSFCRIFCGIALHRSSLFRRSFFTTKTVPCYTGICLYRHHCFLLLYVTCRPRHSLSNLKLTMQTYHFLQTGLLQGSQTFRRQVSKHHFKTNGRLRVHLPLLIFLLYILRKYMRICTAAASQYFKYCSSFRSVAFQVSHTFASSNFSQWQKPINCYVLLIWYRIPRFQSKKLPEIFFWAKHFCKACFENIWYDNATGHYLFSCFDCIVQIPNKPRLNSWAAETKIEQWTTKCSNKISTASAVDFSTIFNSLLNSAWVASIYCLSRKRLPHISDRKEYVEGYLLASVFQSDQSKIQTASSWPPSNNICLSRMFFVCIHDVCWPIINSKWNIKFYSGAIVNLILVLRLIL